jgi:hypothetical protein
MHSIKTAAISAGRHYFGKLPGILALPCFLSVSLALVSAGNGQAIPVPRPPTSKEGALAGKVNAQTRKLLPEKPDAVVILDANVPTTIKTYRLLPPGESYSELLRGSHALITAWAKGERKVRIHAIFSVHAGLVAFVDAATLPAKFFEPLITGDSGNPTFLWLNNEPVLIETHTYGGSGRGPFFSTPENFAKINEAMLKLSKAHKAPVHQLRTVTVD